MTDGPTNPSPMPGVPASLIDRAKNMLLTPKTEWAVIDGEATTVGKLIGGYAAILAVIAPVALLLGMLLTPFGSYMFGAVGFLLKILIVSYALSLGTVVLLGFAIDLLAPNFGGTKNSVTSMKLAVYSGTAFFVAAVALILPGLWWLWLFAGVGYGGYLLWLGLPVLMKVPADKQQAFAGAAIGIWAVMFIILQQIGWRVIYAGMIYGLM